MLLHVTSWRDYNRTTTLGLVAAALNAQPLLLGVAGLIAYCLHDIGEDLPPKGTAVVMCAPAPCNPRTQAATMCVGPSARYRMACSTLPPATLHSTQAATLKYVSVGAPWRSSQPRRGRWHRRRARRTSKRGVHAKSAGPCTVSSVVICETKIALQPCK